MFYQEAVTSNPSQTQGTVKQRLFFVVRKELTDEEIIKKIGKIYTIFLRNTYVCGVCHLGLIFTI